MATRKFKHHFHVFNRLGSWPKCWIEKGVFYNTQYHITNDWKKVDCKSCLKFSPQRTATGDKE